MTKYLSDAAFTVGMPTGQRFRDNWDRIFSKKKPEAEEPAETMADALTEAPQKAADGTPGA